MGRPHRDARAGNAGGRRLAQTPRLRPRTARRCPRRQDLHPPRPVCRKTPGLLFPGARPAGRARPAGACQSQRHHRRVRFPIGGRPDCCRAHRVRHQVLSAGRGGRAAIRRPGRPQPGRQPGPQDAQGLRAPAQPGRASGRPKPAAASCVEGAGAGQRLAVLSLRQLARDARHRRRPLPRFLVRAGRDRHLGGGRLPDAAAPAVAGAVPRRFRHLDPDPRPAARRAVGPVRDFVDTGAGVQCALRAGADDRGDRARLHRAERLARTGGRTADGQGGVIRITRALWLCDT
ncbi:hypothetical protein MASSI9I_10100 [Massilia sp. 9I]|nr:hypothetical protein MASSI9I_10100 [Massilia sp. 9I]